MGDEPHDRRVSLRKRRLLCLESRRSDDSAICPVVILEHGGLATSSTSAPAPRTVNRAKRLMLLLPIKGPFSHDDSLLLGRRAARRERAQ